MRPIGVTKYNHVPFFGDNRKRAKQSEDDQINHDNEENEDEVKEENIIIKEEEKKEEKEAETVLGKRTAEEIQQEGNKFTSKMTLVKNDEMITCRPTTDIRGHTSYLIFARKSVPKIL